MRALGHWVLGCYGGVGPGDLGYTRWLDRVVGRRCRVVLGCVFIRDLQFCCDGQGYRMGVSWARFVRLTYQSWVRKVGTVS